MLWIQIWTSPPWWCIFNTSKQISICHIEKDAYEKREWENLYICLEVLKMPCSVTLNIHVCVRVSVRDCVRVPARAPMCACLCLLLLYTCIYTHECVSVSVCVYNILTLTYMYLPCLSWRVCRMYSCNRTFCRCSMWSLCAYVCVCVCVCARARAPTSIGGGKWRWTPRRKLCASNSHARIGI
jgi:hypothetical protein